MKISAWSYSTSLWWVPMWLQLWYCYDGIQI